MRSRGFTMIEVMTVLGIIGILAGLSAIALTRLKSRGNFASATGDFVATLRTARAEAFARGDNTIVYVDTQGGQWWAIEDADASFDFASFDGGVPTGDRLIYYGSLPPGTMFGPTGGIGTALAMPYCGIPTGVTTLADGGTGCTIVADGGSTNPNLKYCSFCDPGTGKGAITFFPGGGASFSGGPATVGQQIAIANVVTGPDGGASGGPFGIIDFAIVSATGAIEAVTIK
jgi:prepilin-type N-terminal cleavage/methylation domain-containing protein